MDHMKVLKRAWQILWHYRALWIFGIILALTAPSTRGNDARYAFDSQDFEARGFEFTPPGDVQRQLQELGEAVSDVIERAFSEGIPAIVPQGVAGGMIALIVGLLCLVLLLTAIAIVARQVSEVALIRMVNDHEETGDMLKVRQGFRLGWSRAAWRIFLIDLIINVLLLVAFVVPAAIALLPLLAWTARDTTLGILGTVVAIGLFFLLIFLMIGVVTVVRLLKRFIHRAAALEGLGVFAAMRHGYRVVRQDLKAVGLMWLIMFGINLVVLLLAFPLVLLFLVTGGLAGGATLLIVRGLVGLFASGATPWVIGALIGGPIFFLVLFAPLALVGGLHQTFDSTTWTLTYREIGALGALEPLSEPDVEDDDSVDTAEQPD